MDDKSDNLGCSECVDLLADYLDGALPRAEAERLEWHLAACPPCVAFVKTYKGTVDATARLRQDFECDMQASAHIHLAEWESRPLIEKLVGPVCWILERQQ